MSQKKAKKARKIQTDTQRVERNRERNRLLKEYCVTLGISPYTPVGGEIYAAMRQAMEQQKNAIEAGRNHPALAVARGEIKMPALDPETQPKQSAASLRQKNKLITQQAQAMALKTPKTKSVILNSLNSARPIKITPPKANYVSPDPVGIRLQGKIHLHSRKQPKPRAHTPAIPVSALRPTDIKPSYTPDEMAEIVEREIPASKRHDFALFVRRNLTPVSRPQDLVNAFKAQNQITAQMMEEPTPEEPKSTQPTLQVIRVPSLEVIEQGHTGFYEWLTANGYDTTGHETQGAEWANGEGWHFKQCTNVTTGADDFWLIAFNNTGGEVISEKSQRDYRSAYRRLLSEGYAPAAIESMTRGEMYIAYNEARSKGAAARAAPAEKPAEKTAAKPTPAIKQIVPIVDTTDYTEDARSVARTANMRDAGAQAAFAAAVLANCYGKCAVSGLSFIPALQAAHIESHSTGGKMQVCNGIMLDAGLHRAFDTGHMAINPGTLTAHFSPEALASGYHHLEGRKIETVHALDSEALAARWIVFAKRFA